MIGVRLAQGRVGDVEKYLAAGQGAARRAAALTHRLLAFSRRQTLTPKPVVVNRMLGDLSELVRRTVGPQINVETVAAAGLWPAMVDVNQLENALLNLCINARDAMTESGAAGVISVVLAVMVFGNFLAASASLLGILLAIELISSGMTMLSYGFYVRKHPEVEAA